MVSQATETRRAEYAKRTLVVAAHPDDETIGCGALLSGLKAAYVVHVTDGAPRDSRFVPPAFVGNRSAYAERRRHELTRALALAQIGPARTFSLGGVDQEACEEIVRLSRALCELVAELRPDIVIAHAYEGGHPDHDAACVIAHMARALLAENERPLLVEMASYHGAPGRLVTGGLLPRASEPLPIVARDAFEVLAALDESPMAAIVLVLSECDRARKAEMLRCFDSQREVLSPFETLSEPFRLAPSYDFSEPPHEGPLYYEKLGWPMTGAAFRQRAALARDELLFGGAL